MKTKNLRIALLTAGMLALWMSPVRASILYLGGAYSSGILLQESLNGGPSSSDYETGGSIDPSTLSGAAVAVYCVDLFDNVGVPATYNATVTTDGFVNNQLVDNAGQVAWLLDHYATTGQGVGAVALQAAIWHVIYNGSAGYARGLAVALDSSSPSYSTYTAMLSALGNQIAPLSDVDWLTPTPDNLSQGLVAATPVPEPATVIAGVAMLLPFGVSVLRMLRRKEAA